MMVSRDGSTADISFMLGPLRKQSSDAGSRRFRIKKCKEAWAARCGSVQGRGRVRARQARRLRRERLRLSFWAIRWILSPVRRLQNASCCASQRLFARFKRLFCRITGKWLDTGVTNGEYGLISGGLPSSAPQSLLWAVISKKIPVLRPETSSHMTAHTTSLRLLRKLRLG